MKLAALLLLAASVSAATLKVQVRGRVIEVPLEKYVAAVLAGEAGTFRSDEALKAMAITARTYAIRQRGRHAKDGFDLCVTTHCQRADLDAVTPRLQNIADATAGELLWYRGKLAFTPYSLDCGGRTEDAAAVWPDEAAPYLKSHRDEYCVRSGPDAWHWTAGAAAIASALAQQGIRTPAHLRAVRVIERTDAGRALRLQLIGEGTIPIAAGVFRTAVTRQLGWNTLPGDWFDAEPVDDKVAFSGRGSGHGVGLCQRGADRMGAEGRTASEILAYYFPGTVLGPSASGFEWVRLSGERVTLYTTRPPRDTVVLAAAEQAIRDDLRRTGYPAPNHVEIRVYPDAAAFRDATGEPGWVAAYTHGSRIEMQPLRDPAAALRHEFYHMLIESEAGVRSPLWFREGLVEYLADGAPHTRAVRIPSDGDLAQRTDAARARRAYEDAAATVAGLVRRYGEGAVLRWVKSGIPSSAINPAVNSK